MHVSALLSFKHNGPSMSDAKQNSELIQWLRLLSLPAWMKVLLVVLMASLFSVGVGLIYAAFLLDKLEFAASGATLLTVWLPIALIIVALVFGVSGSKALSKETTTILRHELPTAIRNLMVLDDLPNNITIKVTVRGCIAKYELQVNNFEAQGIDKKIRFNIELNVKKTNLVVWFCTPIAADQTPDLAFEAFKQANVGTLAGAHYEGYTLNATPAIMVVEEMEWAGAVFILQLDDDFLMKASHRMYWVNDCAFFIKGLLAGHDFDVVKHV